MSDERERTAEPTAAQARSPITLSISIVVYRPDAALLARTIETLESALAQLHDVAGRPCLYLIDNGNPGELADLPAPSDAEFDTVVLKGHGNVGYGRGHNLAIERTDSRYHLILNPDIELNADALRRALAFLRDSPETGLLSPWIGDDDGRQQFLCRRYPTVLDLFARGFLPSAPARPVRRTASPATKCATSSATRTSSGTRRSSAAASCFSAPTC